ncbi:GNAT family N-acetyltransferase [Peribacillus deserti]|uniref:GNAT family N-acetyltransferase n=1 Tax=Peribacillus deserti TaxID=673318 RepID=A0A2N5M195_9BACI|nr:GNAT family N-acetyltransferase [Peribacillus deserti]PLT28120.1 GNAT family N-acetyltransferase [Peribacillus deserti]
MLITQKEIVSQNANYIIRSAQEGDAKELSQLRVKIDGETENLDREPGEGFIDEYGFRELIRNDTEDSRNLFLIAEVNGKLAGFSRCEGNSFKRFSHKAEFGIGIQKDYWGLGIGKQMLQTSIDWAEANGIKKITLAVLETNEKAIALYRRYGFEIEGVLKKDKRLSDGNYYNTILMGRFHD